MPKRTAREQALADRNDMNAIRYQADMEDNAFNNQKAAAEIDARHVRERDAAPEAADA